MKIKEFPNYHMATAALKVSFKEGKNQKQGWGLASGLGKELSSQDCLQFYTVGTSLPDLFPYHKERPSISSDPVLLAL